MLDAGIEEDVTTGDVAEALVERNRVELSGEGDTRTAYAFGLGLEPLHDDAASACTTVLGEDGDASDVGALVGWVIE